MLTYLLFVIGFVFLVKGADFLVDGAASVAKKFSISNIVIGLTVVAFGTSAPELIVTILSGLSGSSDLVLGNIMGSNISNILLILGVAAIIYPLQTKKGTVWKEIPFALLAVLMAGALAADQFIDGLGFSLLSRSDGIVLLGFFIIFMYYTFGIAKVDAEDGEEIEEVSTGKSVVLIVAGLIGLALGGNWIVSGAQTIAGNLGVPESVIGLTIVALGTSLPELATAVAAARKKQADIVIGNVVGSNIFNTLMILGAGAATAPLVISTEATSAIIVTIAATLLLFMVMFVGKRHLIERWQGWLFVVSYVVYMGWLLA